MIRSSFIFLEQVRDRTELAIWRQGIRSWSGFLGAEKVHGLSLGRKKYYERKIREAMQALHAGDSSYFSHRLAQRDMWRLYSHFRDEAVFLDIETTGVGEGDRATVVGLYDGDQVMTMVDGINLDYRRLKAFLSRYKLIVSFNGLCFDSPFLKKQYPDLLPDVPHIDIRFLCQNLGYRGGLKQLESVFNCSRRDIIDRLHGGDPATLWRMWRGSGDRYYLDLLVEYNEEDVVNLKVVADKVVRTASDRLRSLMLAGQHPQDVVYGEQYQPPPLAKS